MVIKTNKAGTLYEELNGDITRKECTECKEMKCITEFHKEQRSFAGVKPPCKVCFRVKSREIRRKYREKNPEKVREWNQNSYRNNPEKHKQNSEKWRVENPEKRGEYNKKYYTENADKVREYARRWEFENPEKVSASVHNRRARDLGLPWNLKDSDIASVFEKFKGCAISGDTLAGIDHFIPLSLGGPGSVPENIISITHALNSSKANKNPFEWFADNKERLALSQANFDKAVAYLAELNVMTITEYRDYVYRCFDEEVPEWL